MPITAGGVADHPMPFFFTPGMPGTPPEALKAPGEPGGIASKAGPQGTRPEALKAPGEPGGTASKAGPQGPRPEEWKATGSPGRESSNPFERGHPCGLTLSESTNPYVFKDTATSAFRADAPSAVKTEGINHEWKPCSVITSCDAW